MKIAQIAPIIESVPPKRYGGTERIVSALTEALVKRGHDVTLFASGDSITSAKLVATYPISLRRAKMPDMYGSNFANLMSIGVPYQMQNSFDIIHDHVGPTSLPAANISGTPVVATLHSPMFDEKLTLYEKLNNPFLVSISKAQIPASDSLNHIATIHNGLNMTRYPFSDTNDGYLLYVGRIIPNKGLHHAIDIAKTTGLKLLIAAKLEYGFPPYREYFDKKIKPHLSDQIVWVGEISEKTRNKMMAKALAFLHPACWEEPFGLTMIEALACGAPVVAFNRGSVPEIVTQGKTGYVVKNVEEMIFAVARIDRIKRTDCRQHALSYFNAERMTDEYEMVYRAITEGAYAGPKKTAGGATRNMPRHTVHNKNANGTLFPF